MKRIALSLIALVFSLGSIASPVSPEVSRRAAANFWNSHRPADVKSITPEQMNQMAVASLPMLHIWAVDQTGFIIMAASDAVKPVLAYSFNSPATREPNAEVMFWLRRYNEQIAAVEETAVPNTAATAQWQSLLNDPIPADPVDLVVVPQLMTTKWNQSEPYNNLCPFDSTYHSRTVVGCVATAMAQIMKYWNHPSTGTGYHSYEHQGYGNEATYGMLEANFGQTTYMWELMPNFLNVIGSNQRAINAVATLSYHCGVAVDMMYGPSALGGSAAYSTCGSWATACALNAFRDYFKYNPDLFHVDRDVLNNDSLWIDYIDSNLAQNAPIYYTGRDSTGGHAFVLDGSNEQGLYHFNWGWGGSYDGYYGIDNVAPGGGGAGGNATYTFNYDQGAIFGILPLPEHFDSVTIYDTICRNVSSYQFHDYIFPATDSVYHAVYLDTFFTINLSVISTRRLYVNNNGGTGANYDRAFCPTDGVTLPNCNFTRPNHIFIGWGFDRFSNDTLYQPGDHLMLRTSKTIYATWRDTTVHNEDTVGIATVNGTALMIAPNPTRDHIDISLSGEEDAIVTIIDQFGRVAIKQKVIGGKAKIMLDKLSAGTYTVHVITSGTEYKSRIIKL